MQVRIEIDGHEHLVSLTEEDGRWWADVDGERFPVRADHGGQGVAAVAGGGVHLIDVVAPDVARIDGADVPFRLLSLSGVAGAADETAGQYGPMHPPMTGRLDAVLVQAGDVVEAGDVLFVLEAMKMRNEVKAAAAGTVTAVHAKAGQAVDPRTVILELVPTE